MRQRTLLFTLFFMLILMPTFAQERTVKGTVISAEDNLPIIGANIRLKGTTLGTVTNIDGQFAIAVKGEAVLVFSYVGMESIEKKVAADVNNLNVKLLSDTKALEEVVVVAYGVRKKGTIAGSVSVVKSEKLGNVPTASFDQALQGQTPGLQVLSNTGEPSSPASFQIRGTNSINAGVSPLFILDGIAISNSDFTSINPADIESVSVLKDASSTSIYGARAANGVVVITTKRGKMGEKGKINLRTQFGFSNLAYGNWTQMNTTQRLDYEEEIGVRIAGTYDREALERINVDWRDVVYNNFAPMSSYELSTSGATNRINYYVSAATFRQEGITIGSDFTRYTVRTNLEARLNDWAKIGTNTALAYEQMHTAPEGEYSTVTPISASRFMLPYWSPYRKGTKEIASVRDGSWLGTNQNPLEWNANNYAIDKKAKLMTSLFLEINPIKNLVLRTVFGLDALDYTYSSTTNPSYLPNQMVGGASKAFSRNYNLTSTTTANYLLDLGDMHHFNFLLGQEAVLNQSEGFNLMARGQSNDKLLSVSAATYASGWGDSQSSSSYLSFFGRGEYNYNDKYYADFSLRRDGSSKFGVNARWANFWSVGLMWNAGAEDFLAQNDWLTNAQLSFSAGTSGNSSIPMYDHIALVAGGPKYDGIPGIAPYTRGNEDLTWEKLFTLNAGLKLGFFDRINMNVEVYNKVTSDMLMEVPVSFIEGNKMKWDNIGSMLNRGAEIDLNVDVIRNREFVWNISANLSYNYNEITELYSGRDEYVLGETGLLLKVGHPCGEFYLNRYAGVDPANGDPLWLDKTGNVTRKFDPNDKVLVGKGANAPFQGGFGTTASYKGFSLNVLFSWVADRYMVNNDRYFDESNGTFSIFNQSTALLDRWKNPGDITEIPRHGIPTQIDTHLLEDASFMRLKNLGIAYQMPTSLLRKTGIIERVKFFGQAQNLFTFTGFSGMDPESDDNMYAASYPLSRQFTFGVEISF